MRFVEILIILFVAFLAVANCNESSIESSEEIELPLAESCDEDLCQLPDCRCSSTRIPGGLNARDVPQFVMLTFDDGINVVNIETYRRTIYNRYNSNGCKAGVTFYVSHEYTNYQLVNELHQNGFEIALHSISHQTPQTYWAQATYEDIMREFGDQKRQMSQFAAIPIDDIKGMRIPFLQMAGNNSFQVMSDVGLQYDSTWGTINSINPGLWPYTLDYASTQECLVPPCPTASIPGVWELPMVGWLDVADVPCSMVDSCHEVPPFDDEDAWFMFILRNFERHYMGNRAPFGFFIHEWYVSSNPAVEGALVRFMDMINKLGDVFMVNANEVIDWVRHPVPINEYREKLCPHPSVSSCLPVSCGPLSSEHNQIDYWMTLCGTCPAVYPWLGNPFGLAQ